MTDTLHTTDATDATDAPLTPYGAVVRRVRDIRDSEQALWRKLIHVYATSVDYDPQADGSRELFRTLQNRMHLATHGHTAAALIQLRASASRPNMGLVSWAGPGLRQADLDVAKNYLTPEELTLMHRIVHTCLDFAELQALSRRPMRMADWLAKLDELLRLADRELPVDESPVTREAAKVHVRSEYARWRSQPLDAA